ncbi:MAG: hypothetical protein B6242_14315 [Anaerolineaceae bacterium 4572_78]|nr:MAG: hypothetical protein B6242_14315 [Anaerolineaceae bacterium 4572_78]
METSVIVAMLGVIILLFVIVGLGLSIWWDEQQPVKKPTPDEQTEDKIRQTLISFFDTIDNEVPMDVRAKLVNIRNSILDVLPRIEDINSSDSHIHAIRQTVLMYLPETLDNYLTLSRDYVMNSPLQGGKTAHQLLLEQLDLLDQEMKNIAKSIDEADSQKLLIQGRFLEERFSTPTHWLEQE